MRFAKGTRLDCIAHFDNSPFNPYNPNPLATVRFGLQTHQEMMYGFFFYTDAAESSGLKSIRRPAPNGRRVRSDEGPFHVITNFGGNIRFTPRYLYTPTSEAEVLTILDQHAHGKIRVIGALHSWSPAVVCDDAIVDMRHFDSVELHRGADGEMHAIVGGGCRIKHLLDKLHRLGDVTMPTLGLITEQAIAGAISTATHGSGSHSLSHFIAEMRSRRLRSGHRQGTHLHLEQRA